MTAIPDLPPPRRINRLRWIGVLFRWLGRALVVSLLIWLVWFLASGEWRNEIARWHLASAAAADSPDAIRERLARAMRWSRGDPQVSLAAARWHASEGRLNEALQTCESLAQSSDRHAVAAWQTQSEILQQAGRFSEAVEAEQRILAWVQGRLAADGGATNRSEELLLASALNSVAYIRALADQDVELSEPQIEEALKLAGENSAMLDTRGYILWRLGKLEPARKDLDRAIELAENELTSFMRRDVPLLEKDRVDMRPVLQQARMRQRSVAVLRYHRAVAVQDTEPQQANQDYERIGQLGFSPGPALY